MKVSHRKSFPVSVSTLAINTGIRQHTRTHEDRHLHAIERPLIIKSENRGLFSAGSGAR